MKNSTILLFFVLLLATSCELQEPAEYVPSKIDRWDKTVNALEFIRQSKGIQVYSDENKTWRTIVDSSMFSKFDSLIRITKLDTLFSRPGAYTFLVPSNKAFMKFMSNWANNNGKWMFNSLKDFPDSLKVQIVKSHVLIGKKLVTAEDFPVRYERVNLTNMLGKKICLIRDDQDQLVIPTYRPYPWNPAKIELLWVQSTRTSNIEPTNGAIHVIDQFYMDSYKYMGMGTLDPPASN